MVLLVVIAAGGTAAWYYAAELIERRLRPATIVLLESRFDSEVTLGDLSVAFTPSLSIRVSGLELRHRGRKDIPPIITIRSFSIESSVRELWNRHIDRIRVEGLEIMIPPKRGEDMPSLSGSGGGGGSAGDVYIHELIAEESRVLIMPKRAGKNPRVFDIARLRFADLRFANASAFAASITNPTPHGQIEAVGTFGPWHAAEPGLTPVSGSFTFAADLGTIKGIGGDLQAEGTFSGPLERIETRGKTRTPNFRLSTGGAAFPLTTDYLAVVDGTSGDTFLESVNATLAESEITARGQIVNVPGVKGRHITLDTTTKKGRLEDFVRLTTRVATSPMSGIADVQAKLDIPPGDREVIERMTLAGTFNVARARFTSPQIQDRVDELSRRGRGKPKDETIDNVASNFRGSFALANARMTLQRLSFRVQGAEVRLAGNYDIASERLNFTGQLRLDAPVSKTQTGWKSLVLKLFDPLFREDGVGTLIPISIAGTRARPEFKADIKKAVFGR